MSVALIVVVSILIYGLWMPGVNRTDGKFDLKQNAIWLGHGWLGDDKWFKENRRKMADFRAPEKIDLLFKRLKENHIKYVYPHLCPAQRHGAIAAYDSPQFERVLDMAQKYDLKVVP